MSAAPEQIKSGVLLASFLVCQLSIHRLAFIS